MAHFRPLGITQPEVAFERLRPFRDELLKLEQSIRPNTSDQMVMAAVRRALETAAYHFTREPDFYMRAGRGAGHTA